MSEGLLHDPLVVGGSPTRIQERLNALKSSIQKIEMRTAMPFPASGQAVTGYWAINVTSGAWITTWQGRYRNLAHPGIIMPVPWITGVGTTASIRLKITTATQTVTSNTRTFAANDSYVDELGWLHGVDLWSGEALVELEAIRLGGANALVLFCPFFEMVDPQGSAGSGGAWIGHGS